MEHPLSLEPQILDSVSASEDCPEDGLFLTVSSSFAHAPKPALTHTKSSSNSYSLQQQKIKTKQAMPQQQATTAGENSGVTHYVREPREEAIAAALCPEYSTKLTYGELLLMYQELQSMYAAHKKTSTPKRDKGKSGESKRNTATTATAAPSSTQDLKENCFSSTALYQHSLESNLGRKRRIGEALTQRQRIEALLEKTETLQWTEAVDSEAENSFTVEQECVESPRRKHFKAS